MYKFMRLINETFEHIVYEHEGQFTYILQKDNTHYYGDENGIFYMSDLILNIDKFTI